MRQHTSVALIGAGIAGLSCATKLQKAGYKVTLFEKSRGVSGRLSTRSNVTWQCDHGAQYFTARDPIFAAEVERWVNADIARLWQPGLKVFDGVNFEAKTEKHESSNLRYVGYPRNNMPSKWLAASLHVETETTITEIVKTGQRWQLFSKEHGLITERFDMLIFSIPAPQARIILERIDTPLLTLCDSVAMRPCFALMLNLKHKLSCDFDGLFINNGPLSWAARDSSKPGRIKNLSNDHESETWVLHASSDWSLANIDVAIEEVAQKMLTAFKIILQSGSNLEAADQLDHALHEYSIHRWLYADCAQFSESVFGWDHHQNIGLCGDWLNGGKVQGAWLSGLMLAKQIIAAY